MLAGRPMHESSDLVPDCDARTACRDVAGQYDERDVRNQGVRAGVR